MSAPRKFTIDDAVEHIALLSPSLIAIGGLPCAGKSTMARRLVERLGATCIELDEFVLPQRDWGFGSNAKTSSDVCTISPRILEAVLSATLDEDGPSVAAG
jgi:hypothetical protein